MPRVARGAKPSPRHRLAAATPHTPTVAPPPQFLWLPWKLSMWGNAVDGDCVTAEEAFAKACNNPEIFISDDEVVAWAGANGFLNGAALTDVMSLMQKSGFTQDSNQYDDGPYNSVDWTNPTVLQSAISMGPVKIGIAADQIESVYQAYCPDSPKNGWIATGFTPDSNEDHCVSLCGYGPTTWVAAQLGRPLTSLPIDLSGNAMVYAMFTWSSIGIIEAASMLAITAEAWVRKPTTIVRAATTT